MEAPCNKHLTQNWCCTQSKPIESTFTWTIENFSLRSKQVGEMIESSEFSAGREDITKWRLSVDPNGSKKWHETTGYVTWLLTLVYSKKREIMAECKINYLNTKGEEIGSQGWLRRPFELGKPQICWDKSEVYTRNYLLNKANNLLPDDKLTIRCVISYLEENEHLTGSNRVGVRVADCSRLAGDFQALLSPAFADVTLAVGSRDILVHKAILGARSAVFKAHKMTETNDSRVKIEDVEYEAMMEVIQFIYSGKTPKVEKMTGDLLAAADKYDIEDIKFSCEETICENLSIENAVDLLLLANRHSLKDLAKITIDFINSSANKVKETPQWKDLVKNHPTYLEEIYPSLAT